MMYIAHYTFTDGRLHHFSPVAIFMIGMATGVFITIMAIIMAFRQCEMSR